MPEIKVSDSNAYSEDFVFSFPPYAAHDAEKLILGSMPGEESLRQFQYYAHPRNAFWKIMGELFDFDPRVSYVDRIEFLICRKIALWDTVHRCVRPGSMDADIKLEVPNDFELFFKKYPNIKKIFFNGQTAYRLFKKHVAKMDIPEVEHIIMPSTSPANASISYEGKLEAWKRILD
jgi:hypoxanthine-DNA glycosylase